MPKKVFIYSLLILSCKFLPTGLIKGSELTVKSRKIYIDIIIRNHKLRFLLDTGASFSAISRPWAHKLNLKMIGKAKIAGAQRKWKKVNIYRLPHFQIGSKKLPNIELTGSKLSGYDGILGIDILKKLKIITIDLVKNKIHFKHIKNFTTTSSFQLMHGKKILIPIRINNKTFKHFIFDTGGGTSDISYNLQRLLQLKKTGNTVNIVDVNGVVEKSYFVEASSFCLKNYCKKNFQIMPAKYHNLVT
ncbi:MAG: hypothetical protein HOO06_00885 [Bdellovibrionaceae bacterium]|jgi:predicted aspartyl protease|nr:hypothetical protein [Pseudobdellovibrionaceae bacterium]